MNPRVPLAEPGPRDDLRALGARVRELREAAGLTQQQLADGITASRSTIARFEAGTNDLGASRLQALAASLGVEPGEIFRR